MGFSWDPRNALDTAASKIATGAPTGFGENFAAAWDTFTAENLTFSRETSMAKAYQAQADRAKEAGLDIGNPIIEDATRPPDLSGGGIIGLINRSPKQLTAGEKYDQKIIELNKARPDLKLKTSQQLLADIAKKDAQLRMAEADIASRSTFTGKIGSIAGAMGGGLSDPVILGTLPFGAAASSTILRAALIEAGIGTATEALIQPEVFSWKKDIGSPYSLGDATANVLLAGVGAGAGAALLKGLAKAIKIAPQTARETVDKFRAKFQGPDAPRAPTAEERAAETILSRRADMEAQNQYRATAASEASHMDAYSHAMKAAGEGIAAKVEAPFPISPVARGIRQAIVDNAPSNYQSAINEIEITPELRSTLVKQVADIAPDLIEQADTHWLEGVRRELLQSESYRLDSTTLDQVKAIRQGLEKRLSEIEVASKNPIKGIGPQENKALTQMKETVQGKIKAVDDRLEMHKMGEKAVKELLSIEQDFRDGKTATEVAAGIYRRSSEGVIPGIPARPKIITEQPSEGIQGELFTGTQAPAERMNEARTVTEQFKAQKIADIDEALTSETDRAMEKLADQDIQIPMAERIDPQTGERTTETVSARELLDNADEWARTANEVKSCL